MQRISSLIIKKLTSSLSRSEEAELQAWVDESDENRRLYERLTDPKALQETLALWQMVDTGRACRDMQHEVNRILWRSRLTRCISIAAIAICILAVAVLLPSRIDMSGRPEEVVAEAKGPQSVDDIKPGVTVAVLSHAAGHNVALNASDTAKVATVLLTETAPADDNAPRELCLDVPRGGEFKVQLEDGTEVWLNSASKLHYPDKFTGDMRKVRIEGEAYLAVATDSLRPFYVETDNQLIRVYGTAFNVRYYPEEAEVFTTLEKGRISLRRADDVGGEFFLTPGHQAVFGTADSRVNVREVNTDVVTSWRKGRFVFEDRALLRIMQDLSRWYDFDFEFADPSLQTEEFKGSIPRYSDFTTAIAILEKCGGIRFSVDDGKVIISRAVN
ncbi:FecR family protein [uncultured Duncaniella sp.]|uniref:FecR family protein n=1 Tax=uncultured Duncaniella sp. TaxID=2768039 RepID=UPI0026041980|nr:FecR family protein [uncultured Duncaniella sp.]